MKTVKYTSLLLLIAISLSCRQSPPVKPYIIICKAPLETKRQRADNPDIFRYMAVSKDGQKIYFNDDKSLYQVGDTIR